MVDLSRISNKTNAIFANPEETPFIDVIYNGFPAILKDLSPNWRQLPSVDQERLYRDAEAISRHLINSRIGYRTLRSYVRIIIRTLNYKQDPSGVVGKNGEVKVSKSAKVKGKIAVGYNFSPVTVELIEQLAKYHEINRTALLERLVKEEYESLIQRSQFPPATGSEQLLESVQQ